MYIYFPPSRPVFIRLCLFCFDRTERGKSENIVRRLHKRHSVQLLQENKLELWSFDWQCFFFNFFPLNLKQLLEKGKPFPSVPCTYFARKKKENCLDQFGFPCQSPPLFGPIPLRLRWSFFLAARPQKIVCT